MGPAKACYTFSSPIFDLDLHIMEYDAELSAVMVFGSFGYIAMVHSGDQNSVDDLVVPQMKRGAGYRLI